MPEAAAFPVLLDLRGRPCVVVGGGPVAARRAAALLAAGARLTVVSPELEPELTGWARAGRLRHLARAFRARDLDGAVLAFAATGDADIDAAVAQAGRARGVWVNAADDPAHCDFLLPAVLRRGPLVVAVGTGGASPALARLVRDELERLIGPDHEVLAELAGAVRLELHGRGLRAPGEAWRRALGPEVRRLIGAGQRQEAAALMRATLRAGAVAARALDAAPPGPGGTAA